MLYNGEAYSDVYNIVKIVLCVSTTTILGDIRVEFFFSCIIGCYFFSVVYSAPNDCGLGNEKRVKHEKRSLLPKAYHRGEASVG